MKPLFLKKTLIKLLKKNFKEVILILNDECLLLEAYFHIKYKPYFILSDCRYRFKLKV